MGRGMVPAHRFITDQIIRNKNSKPGTAQPFPRRSIPRRNARAFVFDAEEGFTVS